jgi:hypothetical protein
MTSIVFPDMTGNLARRATIRRGSAASSSTSPLGQPDGCIRRVATECGTSGKTQGPDVRPALQWLVLEAQLSMELAEDACHRNTPSCPLIGSTYDTADFSRPAMTQIADSLAGSG